VSYTKGDVTDINSLRQATDGVDKVSWPRHDQAIRFRCPSCLTTVAVGVRQVVFVAQAKNSSEARSVDYLGLRNLAQAFQETRITESGKQIATKRTLFKFRKSVDKDVWDVQPPADGHSEASWAVQDVQAGRPAFSGTLAPSAPALMLESKKLKLDLSKFGGLIMFFKASGRTSPSTNFRFVIRTARYAEQGVQYEMALPAVWNRFLSFRMNFNDFVPFKNGLPCTGLGAAPLDPADVQQFAITASRCGTDVLF
jgi:hypothetical protein